VRQQLVLDLDEPERTDRGLHIIGRDGSDLVILDASDFTASPVATVALPQRVPFGFHGSWVADGDL